MQLLIQKVSFLQDFLENYPHVNCNEANGLTSRIANLASSAEEVILWRIESIPGASTSQVEAISSVYMYEVLGRVLEELEFIAIEVMEIKEKADSSISADVDASRSTRADPPNSSSSLLVGLDGIVLKIMDKLTGELPSNLFIIPIVGMGGIGKTTLAKTIYENPCITQHFDIRVWQSVSLEFNVQEFFLQLLKCVKSSGTLEGLSDHELGTKVFQTLWGRRYLVVLDDLWTIESWEKVASVFPDNKNGSRIMITTRLSNMASNFTDSYVHEMEFLDEEKSWDLFQKHVFGEVDFPLGELENMGKRIARECGGLPLSIVVISGLLAKSPMTLGYWEFLAENLSSAVNLTDNQRCLRIMQMSYNQLPVYLKPCFLYFAIFPRNNLIRVSRLLMLWVAQGFLRPFSGKSLEIVAEECLRDLIDRNLIIVRKYASDGKIKFCRIHDLLRDLCIKESTKENCLGVAARYSFGIHQSTTEWDYHDTMSLYRPYVCVMSPRDPSSSSSSDTMRGILAMWWLQEFIRKAVKRDDKDGNALGDIFEHVNLRYLAMYGSEAQPFSRNPSSLYLLWNLHTLIVNSADITAPIEIWKMPQLRHIIFSVAFVLPDPPQDDISTCSLVLKNLQTLSEVKSFKLSEEVVRRMPNVKKLKVAYYSKLGEEEEDVYCISKIGCLMQLESLSYSFAFDDMQEYLVQNLALPRSLRKLSLEGSLLPWNEMKTLIGPLPHLQVLKLRLCAFTGAVWKTVKEQFCSLKYLVIDTCLDLEWWITESSHFPCLEHIVLRDLEKFIEIPLDVGYIPTLKSIELDRCTDSAVRSAKKLLEEQEGVDNEHIQIRVKLWKVKVDAEELLSLASRNFLIHP